MRFSEQDILLLIPSSLGAHNPAKRERRVNVSDAMTSPTAKRTTSQLHRQAIRLEWFTVSWNVIESVVAITAGALSGSTALIAFGSDSFIEVGSAVVLLWRLKRAGPEAGRAERGEAETRALYLVAGTFFVLAAYVGIESLLSLTAREGPHGSSVGIVLAAVSLVVMPALGFTKHRTGTQMGSKALQADAMETWVCAYLSLALLVGLGLYAAFGLWWADAVGALAMLPVIIWQAIDALKEARSTAS